MFDTQPLTAPATERHGVPGGRRLLLIAVGVLAINAGIRIGLAAVADLPRPVGTLYAVVLLVLAPLAFYAVALYRRATSRARQQVSIGLAVAAAMLTLVGYDRTSVWFMAVSVAVGAGCLSLAHDAANSREHTSSAVGVAVRVAASAVIAFAIAAVVIVVVPGSALQDGYLWSAGATTLVIGPIAVGSVVLASRTLRRQAPRPV